MALERLVQDAFVNFWVRCNVAPASPSLTCQADSVASATDSDNWGTLTSMIMISPQDRPKEERPKNGAGAAREL